MKKTLLFSLLIIVSSNVLLAQKFDKVKFTEYKAGFYQNFILKDVNAVNESLGAKEMDKRFEMDQSGLDLPNKVKLYKQEWHTPVISQGNAGSCWSYSTISMYESEVKRLQNKEVKLSEPFVVYHEYIEKAKGFVDTRGKSIFEQGSEGNAVARVFEKYGVVPLSEYTGLLHGRKYHTHELMFTEMKNFLQSVKAQNMWNEEFVVATVKQIMNKYIGVPPTKFKVDGKEYTPQSYLSDYVKINPEDYVEILSYKQEPYWQQVEYKVPDNWWHSKEYYNVPLNDYMAIVDKAIQKGYTMSIGGDVSEASFSRETNVALVADFDIPSEYINENSRQFRFSNGTTTDDHGMHLVGYYEKDGTKWYLIKDSSSGSRNNDPKAAEFGYYFFHEDYIKLKMMGFTVHKDAVKDILAKFKK